MFSESPVSYNAHAIPLLVFAGSETAEPITDAGVILVRPHEAHEWNAALARIRSDAYFEKN